MKKKVLCFTLILVMLFSMTACGNNSQDEKTSTPVTETEDNTETEAAGDETDTETSDTEEVSIAEPSEEETSEDSEPSYGNEYINTITEWTDDDGNINYWVYISSVFDWNSKDVNERGQFAQECINICLEMIEESGHSMDNVTIKGCLETEDTAFIYDNDTRKISLWIDNTAAEEWEWQE